MDWMYTHESIGSDFFWLGPLALIFLGVLIVWSIFWKGWALWIAARRGETKWFIALLILNTAGLLDIFYIFVIAKRSDAPKHKKS